MGKGKATSAENLTNRDHDQRLQNVLHRLVADGPERRAIDAGEIDALIDYQDKHIILFPSAERALRAAPGSSFKPEPLANAILSSLPHYEYQRLRNDLEPVLLTANQLLHELGAPIRYVYFPTDGVISLLATVEGGRSLEVALVGPEGMVGTSLALGVNVSPVRSMVEFGGSAVRLPELQFRELYRRNPVFREELSRFTYTELSLARQTAACCSFHMVEQRFARRLLMISDRLHSDRFLCTHESMGLALGVRRESVTQAAGIFQARGLISYRRGNIRILNRKGLEYATCRCYTRLESWPVQVDSQISM